MAEKTVEIGSSILSRNERLASELRERFAKRIERVGVFRSTAVDKDRMQFVNGDASPNAGFPIVLGGDGAHVSAQRRRQRRPDDDRIEVTRVVGEINPLTSGGRASLPVRIRADKKARQPHDRGHELE